MHGIKYFFSIKIIRQSRGAKKIFRGSKLPKILSKNIIVQNPEERIPLDTSGSTLLVDIFNICAIIDE
jgi:hypothetical protein